MGKTLEADDENLPFRHVNFLPILQASVNQWDLSPLQAPKPLGLESQLLHGQVALGDSYLLNPKWRRCGQN